MPDTINIIKSFFDPVLEIIKKDSLEPLIENSLSEKIKVKEIINSDHKIFSSDMAKKIENITYNLEVNYTNSLNESQSVIIEQSDPVILHHNNFNSSEDINFMHVPDWYFLVIISVLLAMIWIRILYNKILITLFENSVNYLQASKDFKERNIVRKRFGQSMDLLYLINGSLFLLLLARFFEWDLPVSGDFKIFCTYFGLLLSLMVIRIMIMRITGYIFNRLSLFTECLYHFFIYTKILGIALIPFLISIPYTPDIVKEILIICALVVAGIIYLLRIIRLIIFTIKNVVLLFYLILYLCTLEIIPVLVLFKIILSLR